MAATLAPGKTPAIKSWDLHKPGTVTVRLAPKSAVAAHDALRYNWKPSSTEPNRSQKLVPSKRSHDEVELTLRDKEGRYTYHGGFDGSNNCYLLLQDSQKGACLLAPVRRSYNLNLVSTPDQKDSHALAQQHPHLPAERGSGGSGESEIIGLYGEDADQMVQNHSESTFGEGPSDDPYDWRHFLAGGRHANKSPSPEPRATITSEPHVAPRSTTSTNTTSTHKSPPPSKQVRKPARTAQILRPSAKASRTKKAQAEDADAPSVPPPPAVSQPTRRANVLTTTESKPTTTSTTYNFESDSEPDAPPPAAADPEPDPESVPRIRMDRRASNKIASGTYRDDMPANGPSDEDEPGSDNDQDDDLILDFDPANAHGAKKRKTGYKFDLQPSDGPISLLSAASSPGSRVASPGAAGRSRPSYHSSNHNYRHADDDDVDDVPGSPASENLDVAPFSLGSPANHRARSQDADAPAPHPPTADDEDVDEDDLAAEMERELAAGFDDDDGGHAKAVEESESESEEE